MHFSSANWQVYLQSSLLHFSSTYQAGPVTWLQQSTKSATHCNASQIKKIAVGLFGGKRTRLTIQQPRHVRILNFSSGFASLLRCTEYVKCSMMELPSQRWCSVSPQDWRFPIWQRWRQATATSTAPAQLRVTAESSTATAAQHRHLSQLSDGATQPLGDTAESTDTV